MFFVIRFYNVGEEPTNKIEDPDPLMQSDIMDGRDAFLTQSRDRHWEFASLRRAKFSTMAMLVELHNQGSDRFVYNCNICNRQVIARYHCTVCEVGSDIDNCLHYSYLRKTFGHRPTGIQEKSIGLFRQVV